MRKRVKTITEETHEYGTIVLEEPLYSALLGLAATDGVTKEHIDLWINKTCTISEEVGRLRSEYLLLLTNKELES